MGKGGSRAAPTNLPAGFAGQSEGVVVGGLNFLTSSFVSGRQLTVSRISNFTGKLLIIKSYPSIYRSKYSRSRNR